MGAYAALATKSPKQAHFVDELLLGASQTEAAIAAGYSEKTAKSQASRLMKEPAVLAAYAERVRERAQRLQVSEDDVIRRLIREADYFGKGSSPAARVAATVKLGEHIGLFGKGRAAGEDGAEAAELASLIGEIQDAPRQFLGPEAVDAA